MNEGLTSAAQWMLLIIIVGVFFTGRSLGRAEGMEEAAKRTEKKRGIEIKHVLEFLGWHDRRPQ